MKQIRAALLGFGNRGGIYADHSLDYPDEMKMADRLNCKSRRWFKSISQGQLQLFFTPKDLKISKT